MKISNILSIGGGCYSFFLSELLGLRFKGPIDNVGSLQGIISSKDLFNKKLYKAILNNEYVETFPNKYEGDKFPEFRFNNTHVIAHNDFRLEKTKKELLRRFDNFFNYLYQSKTDKSLFFIYSTIYYNNIDNSINSQKIINELPEYVKHKLLILNCYECNFICDYPILKINHNLLNKMWKFYRKSKNNGNILNIFNDWWSKNKYFYEELNNCKYDLI